MRILFLVCFLGAMSMFSGCAMPGKVLGYVKESPLLLQMSISRGIDEHLKRVAPEKRLERVRRIASLSGDISRKIGDRDVRLSYVYGVAKSEIARLNVPPYELIMYYQLLDQVSVSVKEYVKRKQVDGDKLVSVSEALETVESVAVQHAQYLQNND